MKKITPETFFRIGKRIYLNLLKWQHLPIVKSLAISTLFFLVLIFFQENIKPSNLLFSYYLSLINIFEKNPVLVIVLLVVILLSSKGLRNIHYNQRRRIKNKSIQHHVQNPLMLLILSAHFALLFSLIFAFLHLNFLSLQVNLAPQSAGIIMGDKVVEILKSIDKPPFIQEINKSQVNKEILAIKINSKNTNSFYLDQIILSIPKELIIPLNINKQNLIFLDNNLLISELNEKDLAAISPVLGNLLVKDYFKPRYIKNYPILRVLGRQEFIKVQDEQIDKQLSYIDNILNLAQPYIDQDYANVANDKSKIAYNQDGLNSDVSYRDWQYSNCLSAGYYDYFTGMFIKYYYQGYCDQLRQSWDNRINQWQKNIDDLTQQLNYDEGTLNQDLNIIQSIKNYRSLVENQKNLTPQEYGVTYDTNKIDIALDWTNAKSLTAFLETLTHEYLHYTSYVSEEKVLPIYFEEGITEYYARKVIKKELGQDTNFGYPLLEKVMGTLLAKLPQNDLEEAYFTKDSNSLEYIINKTYGDKFYENNQLNFISLFYGSSDDALKSANDIMKKIDGSKILKQDLFSEPINKN